MTDPDAPVSPPDDLVLDEAGPTRTRSRFAAFERISR